MLRKLIKYDFRCTSKTFIPMMAAFLAVTVLMRVCMETMGEADISGTVSIAVGLIVMSYVGLIYAMLIYSFFGNVSRFNKNLFTDEGYLMNTLPVKPWKHIVSKLVSAFVWYLMSILAIVASFFILGVGNGLMEGLKVIYDDFGKSFAIWIKNYPGVTILAILLMVTASIFTLLLLYFVVSLGHLFKTKRKWGVNIISYFVVITVVSMIFSHGAELMNSIVNAFNINSYEGIATFVLSFINLLCVLLSVLFFALTNYIIGHKLNLE